MTRLALIADQHGNDVAFAAVVEDLERIGVDEIVCLGDVVQSGAEPRNTLERLIALGCRTVLGNADAFLLEVPTDSPRLLTERNLEIRDWTLAQLDESHLDVIRGFEARVEIEPAGVSLVCFHGSPRNYDDVLLPELNGATLGPYLGTNAQLLAGGHTHCQWTRQIGSALYVNPGSVGAPVVRGQLESGLPIPCAADYAIVVVDELGLAVEFRRVSYAFTDFAAAAAESGRPYADEFIRKREAVPRRQQR